MCIIAATLLTACSTVSAHGLFAGVSLEGTGIGTRDDANEAYYGKPVTAGEILAGIVQPPAGARNLIAALCNIALDVRQNSLRERPFHFSKVLQARHRVFMITYQVLAISWP